jgi:hypothetical protein
MRTPDPKPADTMDSIGQANRSLIVRSGEFYTVNTDTHEAYPDASIQDKLEVNGSVEISGK